MRILCCIAIAQALLVACAAPATAPAADAHRAQAAPAAKPSPGATSPASAAPRIAIPNAAQPLPGVLTGGQPSATDLQAAKQAGYRTVISLLSAGQNADEADQARALGLRFVSIPIAGAADLTEQNARRLAEAMDAPDAMPLIVHCASGNRTGALLALKAFYVDGSNREEALDLGTRAGLTSLEPTVEKLLSGAAPP